MSESTDHKAAEDRIYSDFEFDVVTDPEAEAKKVSEIDALITDAAAAEPQP